MKLAKDLKPKKINRIQETVLDLYSEGMTHTEVSLRTGLSEDTISIVLESGSKALGANSMLQAVTIYRRQK